MEILPSALCWRIRVPLFIRIRTIRKSGYFASVLELRPVSRCHESSRRSCCSSRSKSICTRGSASPGNRFNTSIPAPGWQALRSVAMMDTFSPCISVVITCLRLNWNYGARSPCLKPREAREENDRRHVAAILVNIAQSLDNLKRTHLVSKNLTTLRIADCLFPIRVSNQTGLRYHPTHQKEANKNELPEKASRFVVHSFFRISADGWIEHSVHSRNGSGSTAYNRSVGRNSRSRSPTEEANCGAHLRCAGRKSKRHDRLS